MVMKKMRIKEKFRIRKVFYIMKMKNYYEMKDKVMGYVKEKNKKKEIEVMN